MSEGFVIKDGILKGYSGSEERVVIPDGVEEIGYQAFKGCSDLTSVVIPEGVTRVGSEAFLDCTKLSSVELPESLNEIGSHAFNGCSALTSIEIPAALTYLGPGAFMWCTHLASVRLPDGLEQISDSTFERCSSLISVDIPDSVKEIGESAFSGCVSLRTVAIPEGVKEIRGYTFSGCKGLETVSIPGSVEAIGANAFADCESLRSVTMPEGVRKIGWFAFQNCRSMTVIRIPGTVTDIGEEVFDNSNFVTVICGEGSYADRYCAENRLSYIYDYQFEAFHGLLPQGLEKLASPFLADEEKPYIFISYSHKDRERVLEIIKELYESGWKIWYDEGLTIGDRYDETLKTHVRGCSAFLLFVSENSVNSLYCIENEIPWALDNGKPVIKYILDEGPDIEIAGDPVVSARSVRETETALEGTEGLEKGPERTAKGISVVVDPSERDGTETEGFAYCMYSSGNVNTAQAIMLEARNSGCELYDDGGDGDDAERLRDCACMIVFLDRAFLADPHRTGILTDMYLSGRDIAVCQLEDMTDDDLPRELIGLHRMQWLNYAFGISADMNTKLSRHLQKRGCRNTSVLPGFEYEKTDEGIVIGRYTGTSNEIRIESTYGGIPVTGIADGAFENCVRLRAITISDGITRIGKRAFIGCSELVTVSLPATLREIGRGQFAYCESLVSLTVPDGVTGIGQDAFMHCTALSSVTIPGSVRKIGRNAFSECESLSSVIFKDSSSDELRVIEENAFEYCSSLESVDMGNDVWAIGGFAFDACECLRSVKLSDRTVSIGSNVFYNCSSLTSAVIPEGVRDIGKGLFSGCSALVSFRIPDGWRELDETFAGCCSLVSVDIPDSVTVIGGFAFNDCRNLKEVTVPDSVTEIGEYAFSGCPELTLICKPDSYTHSYCLQEQIPFRLVERPEPDEKDDAPCRDEDSDGTAKRKGFFRRLIEGHRSGKDR